MEPNIGQSMNDGLHESWMMDCIQETKLLLLHLSNSLPYSEKFLIGANFHEFCRLTYFHKKPQKKKITKL